MVISTVPSRFGADERENVRYWVSSSTAKANVMACPASCLSPVGPAMRNMNVLMVGVSSRTPMQVRAREPHRPSVAGLGSGNASTSIGLLRRSQARRRLAGVISHLARVPLREIVQHELGRGEGPRLIRLRPDSQMIAFGEDS